MGGRLTLLQLHTKADSVFYRECGGNRGENMNYVNTVITIKLYGDTSEQEYYYTTWIYTGRYQSDVQ